MLISELKSGRTVPREKSERYRQMLTDYHRQPNATLRDALMAELRPYALFAARKMCRRAGNPPTSERADVFRADALLALWHAIDHFDPVKCTGSPVTYILTVVRCQILDCRRKWDTIPRQLRVRRRLLDELSDRHYAATSVHLTPDELAARAGLSQRQISTAYRATFLNDDERKECEPTTLSVDLTRVDNQDAIDDALKNLSAEDRQLIIEHHYEGRTAAAMASERHYRSCSSITSRLTKLRTKLRETSLNAA